MQALAYEGRRLIGSSRGCGQGSHSPFRAREAAPGYRCIRSSEVGGRSTHWLSRSSSTPLQSASDATKSFWRFAASFVAAAALVGATASYTKVVVERHSLQPFLLQECDVSHAAVHRYEVRTGDTLWGIAEQYYDEVDPRVAVAAIRACNGLSTTEIAPGQVLRLPRYGLDSWAVPHGVPDSDHSSDKQ